MEAPSGKEKVRQVFQKNLDDGQLSVSELTKVLDAIGTPTELSRQLDVLQLAADRAVELDDFMNEVFKDEDQPLEHQASSPGCSSCIRPEAVSEEGAPASRSAATLRVIQITDVYMLDNFPSLKTLIAQKSAELEPNSRTISMLTGDFLAPYLLSSIDRGAGMMRILNSVPIDYVTWGNHEADLSHDDVMDRVEEYKGTWINTNMQSHESFETCACQKASEVIEVRSADGSNARKVGLVAVLSDEPNLYKPGAFGGAKIEDPWDTLRTYKHLLEQEQRCDLVLPLCHLYETQDEKTAREFDFPVVLSGHDHHMVDRTCNGTRILKPGSDAHFATVLEITWASSGTDTPSIQAHMLKVADFTPDAALASSVSEVYSILDHLRRTQVTQVPAEFRPLSSVNSRGCCTTAARFLCSAIRDSLNLDCLKDGPHCDCVLINGGNFRGETSYRDDEHMTLESLMSEIGEQVEIVIAVLPGSLLEQGLRETWQSIGGAWMQHDDSVIVDATGLVATIGGVPLERDRMYRVGTTKRFGVQLIPSVASYFAEDPSRQPNPDSGIPVYPLLLHLWAERVWVQIWSEMDRDHDGRISQDEIKLVDEDCSGSLDRAEVLHAINKLVGYDTFVGEFTLADIVMRVAGHTEGGETHLTLQEMNGRRRRRICKAAGEAPWPSEER
eukprot:TRINITY_DN15817_c0_g1_i3.p1 TRINITY_DN15817_c0_g1~~TRINITY_DN15817_c0_g1_i3.p1  ORF type:complete len:670 (+),score=106.48 TRINITY_DN15817_c0_g1_i3:85-2094(+)